MRELISRRIIFLANRFKIENCVPCENDQSCTVLICRIAKHVFLLYDGYMCKKLELGKPNHFKKRTQNIHAPLFQTDKNRGIFPFSFSWFFLEVFATPSAIIQKQKRNKKKQKDNS